MDLGNKNADNLVSKDFNLQKSAAFEIIQTSDIESFKVLNSKSDFIFDFIKERVLKNLISSVNNENCLNLFNFMKVYSNDFKDFILVPLLKFNSSIVEDKMRFLLNSGSSEEKTYAVEFFAALKNKEIYETVRNFLNSNFEPLKTASVKYLSLLNYKDEYNFALETIKCDKDNFDKLAAVEFLAVYGNKDAFYPVYDYFKNFDNSYTVASCLIELKPFFELIKEEKEEEVLRIFSSFLLNFPDMVEFNEINGYLKTGVFDFLIESSFNLGILLIFYLKNKINLILNNGAYLIDLNKTEKQEASFLNSALNDISSGFNKIEILDKALLSNIKVENIIALEIAADEKIDLSKSVRNLLKRTNDNEIILMSLNTLKETGVLDKELVDEAFYKTDNETVKIQIKSLIN